MQPEKSAGRSVGFGITLMNWPVLDNNRTDMKVTVRDHQSGSHNR
jgi:hypothetical protein